MSAKLIVPTVSFQVNGMFSSLKSRNYRIYFTGQGISLVGTWMQNIAMSWLVYRLTGSVFLLGLIGFTSQIPTFVLSPFTGVLTDRYNPHRIMVMAQVLFMMHAAALAILVMLNLIAVWHIIALSLLFGIFSALDAPARQSMVVDLIDDRTYLGNAIALNSALFNSARLIGPAVAGIAIASVGEGICFLINAISYLAVISALLMLKVPQKPEPPKASPYQDEFLGGFRYTFKTAPIRQLIFMLAALSLAGYPFIVLLPAYAGEVLGGDSKTLGFLMSGLGAGALAGALIMAARKPASGLERIITIFTLCMGCAIIIASLSTSMTFSIVTLFFGGLSMILSLAAINTLLQTLAHEPMRGRVMSFYAMALLGTIPIGNLIAGSIASGVGIRYTMLAGGLTTIMAGLGFHLQNKNRAMHI